MSRLALDLKEITQERTCIEGVYAELILPEDMTRWRVWVEGMGLMKCLVNLGFRTGWYTLCRWLV